LGSGHEWLSIAVNPATNKIYATNCNDDNVTVIDCNTLDTALVAAGDYPSAVAVNPITNRVYVTNQQSDNVTVIDGLDNSTSTIPVGDGPRGIDVNALTNRIYVANANSNNVTVIDGATGSTTTVPAGVGPGSISINPIKNKVYVLNAGTGGANNSVTVIDGASNTTTTYQGGSWANMVIVNPVTGKVYINLQGTGTVRVVDEAPVNNTQVLTSTNHLPGDTVVAPQPILSGNAVNRWTPNSTPIMGVLNQVGTAQLPWNWAQVTSGAGTDSVHWQWEWGPDSLILGENFMCALSLEDNAATTCNLGFGTPFAGNLEVYPVYRVASGAGVEESHKPHAISTKQASTIVRGVLYLPSDRGSETGDRAVLLDVSGRKVMDLRRGANDVRALRSGVYFVLEQPEVAGRKLQAAEKVVVTK
jgi:YVTN family beta-propeller protein